jgi:hypothetical protein
VSGRAVERARRADASLKFRTFWAKLTIHRMHSSTPPPSPKAELIYSCRQAKCYISLSVLWTTYVCI